MGRVVDEWLAGGGRLSSTRSTSDPFPALTEREGIRLPAFSRNQGNEEEQVHDTRME
ncbi:hypothetical protein RND71_034377 [Anisodus tanguticus]|uniref:Uncharacterized protein n=1 Tax=Anisodus tanguticus TaxID=243964 RepID=A0AAE1UX01_9SOLA|nr:hypothetical protein RND71_034377 [Anisodus tanguticus]